MPKHITKNHVLDVMRKISLMSLAVCGADNQPQSHMLLFSVDKNFTMYFATTTNSNKYISLQKNNKVGASIFSDKEMFIQIQGVVTEIVDQDFAQILEKLAETATNLPNFWHPLLQIANSKYSVFTLTPKSIRVLDLSRDTISHSASPFINIKI